ncbi:hypothetical protein [Alteribacillus bidgolensis]|nr:hypothetical protein [Alteribacillus bidgolensis]
MDLFGMELITSQTLSVSKRDVFRISVRWGDYKIGFGKDVFS